MATRFFPSSPTCFYTAFRLEFSATLSRPGIKVSNLVGAHRTHTTILVHARTLHYKFDYVWKLPRPLLHQIIVHRQRTLTTWKPFISTKNLGVLGTASVRISKAIVTSGGPGTASMCISIRPYPQISDVRVGCLQRGYILTKSMGVPVKFFGCTSALFQQRTSVSWGLHLGVLVWGILLKSEW
jgi:hypothetical protein